MILELFKTITSIARCSGTYTSFIEFITQYATKYNYVCDIDSANNILCYKSDKKPILCLQSHYDIVCLQDNTIPTLIQENGYIKAEKSTLGADNGIGCAYMLNLMAEHSECEFLFTADEEIGLVGANKLALDIKSSKMLNLDSEEIGYISIGCAGGIDIVASTNVTKIVPNNENKILYEITIDNLDGGHSGVDIDKNIPNSIKLIFETINKCNGDLIDINAGERINSIPKSAKAIIATNQPPKISHKNMKINKIDAISEHYKLLDPNIVKFVSEFQNGVLQYDNNLDIVIDSVNLAIITTTIDKVIIELSARSMDNSNLDTISNNIVRQLQDYGFDVYTHSRYSAWKPEQNEFTKLVSKIYEKYVPNPKLYAIHAGLECAIFKEKFPNLQIVSIGPNIYYPHSDREKCEIKSVYIVYEIIKEIIKSL